MKRMPITLRAHIIGLIIRLCVSRATTALSCPGNIRRPQATTLANSSDAAAAAKLQAAHACGDSRVQLRPGGTLSEVEAVTEVVAGLGADHKWVVLGLCRSSLSQGTHGLYRVARCLQIKLKQCKRQHRRPPATQTSSFRHTKTTKTNIRVVHVSMQLRH